MDLFATVAKVSEIADHNIDKTFERLDECVPDIAKQRIMDPLENED